MKSILVVFLAFLASARAFGIAPPLAATSFSGGSAFVVSQRPETHHQRRDRSPAARRRRPPPSALYMGSMAKFGPFSPAVYVAKIALGQDKLNKIRGKAISLHSQAITDFAEWVGAYHLRTKLIKKAKQNGDTLGFLV
jgi:hypothetical protein